MVPGLLQAFQEKQISLVAGSDPGSKLVRAEELGIPVLDEIAFLLLLEESE